MPGLKYHKSVYELVVEAARALGGGGRVFSATDVIKYVRSKYPDCPYKDSSFRMHLVALSLNNKHAPKRWPSLYKRAFLIQLRGETFKIADSVGDAEKAEKPREESNPELEYSLSLERDLEDHLSRSLEDVEEGLKLVERQKHLPGVGRLDMLARDREGKWVVIELKAGLADEKAVGQLTAYMEYLRENGYENVRGILVAASYTPKAIYAARANRDIKLLKYRVSFTISEVDPAIENK